MIIITSLIIKPFFVLFIDDNLLLKADLKDLLMTNYLKIHAFAFICTVVKIVAFENETIDASCSQKYL